MLDVKLYLLQRLSAMVMAPLVFAHIALMIYAVQGGLSGAEILSRTQGSLFWALFYGSFVIAVSLHATIGVQVVLHETLHLNARVRQILGWAMLLLLLLLGLNAVYSVTVA